MSQINGHRISKNLYISSITSSMEIIAPMFATALNHPGKLLFTCSATRAPDGETTLNIYEHGLIEVSPKKKHIVPFDFDLKYAFTVNPPTLTFQKQDQKVHYSLKSEGDLQMCREMLKSRLNQRGFHQQFKPRKKIGKGNFASVYLAEKLEVGKNFAIKAFSKEAAYSQDKGKECLIKQIEIMRSLNHRCCMKLYQVFESENSLYIVVELLEGGQLYDKIKAKYRFKPNEVRKIIHSILQGLREMHSKKAMHRDLKPENLIFRSEDSWECVIADFGLAEFSDAEEYLFVRCGTPGYVAPEVINIKDMKTKYDPICDMFSLGLIFHILLVGFSAFPGKTYNDVLAQNRASNFTFDSSTYEKVDSNAMDLMIKMLKKNPHDRINAADALLHPYFSSMEEEDEEGDQVIQLSKVPSESKYKVYPNCDSPLLTSANPARKKQTMLKKDSCVDFKMGKENVFTGKVDTVTETGGSTLNSVGKRFQSVVMPKVSKFSTKK